MKKIIFTGKGGVGKTTILSTLCRLLSRDGHKVLVIDCDPSMNLAMSLGIPLSRVVSLGDNISRLQEQIENSKEEDNHHDSMEIDSVIEDYIIDAVDGVKMIVMGTIPYGGAGCLCSSISLVKLLINYLAFDSKGYDLIMVDSQAGVEIFGRGLASEFDLSLVVTEPTPKSVEVARHGIKLSRDLGVKKQILVVNKVENASEYQEILLDLGPEADLIYAVSYDREVVDADKRGVLVLDYSPKARVVRDVSWIKECLLEA